jgi:hypothetical protein
MAGKFLLAVLFCASVYLPALAQASIFSGSYQPTFYYDDNIFDQVQIAGGTGNVLITDGAGPNDLNLQMSFDSKTVSVPLVISGNMATLAQRSYDLGTATALDLVLLSDGNNMALAYVEQQKAGPVPTPLSFAIVQWQRNPTVASPDALIGDWQLMSVEDPNLRDTPNGFAAGSSTGPISFVAGAFFIGVPPLENLPLTPDGNRAYLAGTPVTTSSAVVHALNIMYDDQGSASFLMVASELNDPTDVSLTVGLGVRAPVPEPANWALIAVGLAVFSLRVRSKRRADATT